VTLAGTPQGTQAGAVTIAYRLFSPGFSTLTIRAEFSENGGTFRKATAAPGGDGTSALTATPDGSPHVFVWDTIADIGRRRASVQFRIVADGAAAPAVTDPFTLENPVDPTVGAFTPTTADGGVPVVLSITGSSMRSVTGASLVDSVTGAVFPLTGLSIVSDTQVFATVPATTPGGVYGLTVESRTGKAVSGSTLTLFDPAPVVTAVSPAVAQAAATVGLKVTGGNFASAFAIQLEHTDTLARFDLTQFARRSPAEVSGVAPSGIPSGFYTVFVLNRSRAGRNAPGVQYTAVRVPQVTAIAPTSAINTGTTNLTVSGDHLAGVTAGTLAQRGGTFTAALSGIVVDRNTSLRAVAPAFMRPGQYDLVLSNLAGSGASSALPFTVTEDVPTVTGVTPTSVLNTAVRRVTVQGTNLMGARGVFLESGPIRRTLTPAFVSGPTALVVDVPSFLPPGPYLVTVENTVGVTLVPVTLSITEALPVLTSLAPARGTNDRDVRVVARGQNLLGASVATLAGPRPSTAVVAAPPASAAATDHTTAAFTVPRDLRPGEYTVRLRNTAGESGSLVYTVDEALPVVVSVAPNVVSNDVATPVVLTGSGFFGARLVELTTSPTPTAIVPLPATSNTSLPVTIPARVKPGTFTVRVTNSAGPSAGGPSLTVNEPPPVVTSVVPAGGTNVLPVTFTITGDHFLGASSVDATGPEQFTITPVTVLSFSQLRASFPSLKRPGTYQLRVQNTAGLSASSVNFALTELAPALATISPSSGSNTRTTEVTLTGNNLLGTLRAVLTKLASGLVVTVTDLNVDSIGSVRIRVPPGLQPGLYSVQLVNTAGTSNGLNFSATELRPALTALLPDTGPTTATRTIQVQGANLLGVFQFTLHPVQTDPGLFLRQTVRNFGVTQPTTPTVFSVALTAPIVPGRYRATAVNTAARSDLSTAPFYTVTEQAPVLATIAPASVPFDQFTTVTLTGSGLLGTLSVRFEAPTTVRTFPPQRVFDDTRVEVRIVPPILSGPYTATVTNTLGRSNGLSFTVTDTAFKDRQSSGSIAVMPDNKAILVANISVPRVTRMSLAGGGQLSKVTEITVGSEPTSITVLPAGTRAYVTNRGSGTVSVIDTATNARLTDIPVGTEPVGCVLTPTGRFLYVANGMSSSISVIDTQRDTVTATIALPAGDAFPFATACTNDGDLDDADEKVYVTQYFGQLPGASKPSLAFGDLDAGRVGKVTVVSVATNTIVRTIQLAAADTGFVADRSAFTGGPVPDNRPTSAWPNLLASIFIRGNRAYVVNGATSPEGPVKFNVNEQAFISVIDTTTDAEVPASTINLNRFARGEVPQGSFFNTPWGLAIAPGRTNGYVVSAASDVAVRVTLAPDGTPVITGPSTPQSDKGIVRVQVGKNPRSVTFDTTGSFAFVHNHIGRTISVINQATNAVVDTEASVALPTDPVGISILRGEELFNTSRGTAAGGQTDRMSDNGWGSCFSCHPFGWTDTSVWAFATGPRKSTPLNGTFSRRDPADQRILNWSGIFDEVADFELNIRNVSSGTGAASPPEDPPRHGLMTGVVSGPSLAAFTPANTDRSTDWTDIENYFKFGIRSPISPLRGADVAAGRTAFAEAGCTECHSGPKWTSSSRSYTPPPPAGKVVNGQVIEVLRRVDTFVPGEVNANNQTAKGADGFNPPSLLGFWAFAPFFHHGQAKTVDEVLDLVLAGAQHKNVGIPGLLDDPTKRTQVVRFLRSIDDATPPFLGFKEAQFSSSLALTPDGTRLLAANIAVPTVSHFTVGSSTLTKAGEIGVGSEPTSIAVNPAGTRAYVTNRGSGTVSVLDLATNTRRVDITVGTEPCGCALTPTGRFLYVANAMSNDVSVIDTEREQEIGKIALPTPDTFPFAVAVTNNGNMVDTDEKVYVTQYFAQFPTGSRPNRDLGDLDNGRVGKVSVLSVNTQTLITTVRLAAKDTGFTADRSAFTGNPSPDNRPTLAFPNLLASIFIRGNRAYVVNGASSPEGPVKFNVNEQAFVSVINTDTDSEVTASTINMNLAAKGEGGVFFNTPWGMAIAPGGVAGYVVSAASEVAVRVVLAADGTPSIANPGIVRVPTGKHPRSVIFNGTGTRAFVHNVIGRSVAMIDATNDTVAATTQAADLPTPGSLAASILRGEELFNTSRGTSSLNGSTNRMSDNGWGSCFSCHPFGWTDTVVWAFAAGPRKSTPLNGTFARGDPNDQRILNWSGIFDEVADFELNIRKVSSSVPDTENPPSHGLMVNVLGSDIKPFLPLANTGRAADWSDIENYFKFGIRSPISPRRGTDVSTGRAVFVAAGCAACHGGAKFTSSVRTYTPPPVLSPTGPITVTSEGEMLYVLKQVDTFQASERTATNGPAKGTNGFNPPSLRSWWAFPPFFHHGQALDVNDVLDRVLNTRAHKNAGIPGVIDDPANRAAIVNYLLSIDDNSAPP
jgi:YVTN family beta-propeller protein